MFLWFDLYLIFFVYFVKLFFSNHEGLLCFCSAFDAIHGSLTFVQQSCQQRVFYINLFFSDIGINSAVFLKASCNELLPLHICFHDKNQKPWFMAEKLWIWFCMYFNKIGKDIYLIFDWQLTGNSPSISTSETPHSINLGSYVISFFIMNEILFTDANPK